MSRVPSLLALAALLVVPAVRADARALRSGARPQPSAAIRTRQSAMDGFAARMSRLDALMGAPARSRAGRSRSAEAGR